MKAFRSRRIGKSCVREQIPTRSGGSWAGQRRRPEPGLSSISAPGHASAPAGSTAGSPRGGRQNHRPTNRIRKASSFCLLPPIISYTTVRIRFLQGASYAAYGRRSTIICLGEQAQQSAGRDSSGVESHVGHLRGMCTEIQSRRAPDEGGPGSFYLPEMRTSRHSAQGGCRPGPPARGIADSHSRNFILSAKPSPALCWFKERNA